MIFASALLLAAYDIAKKESVRANRVFTVLFLTSLCGFSSVAAILAATGRMAATLALAGNTEAMAALAVKSLIVGTSWTFAYWALKTIPVTVMAPIRATGPVWTFAGAVAIFAEMPTPMQLAGFALAFGGCILFSLAARFEGFTLRTGAIWLAIAGTLCGSVSALYDKFILHRLAIAPESVLFWFMLGMAILYLAADVVTRMLHADKTPFQWRKTIPFVGVLLAASDFCYFSAVAHPDAHISILSTMRRTSVVFTFLAGGAIFHETNLKRKGIALAAILAGVVVLALA